MHHARAGALPLDGMAEAVSRLEQLLGAARQAGAPVVHVVHQGRRDGLFDPARHGAVLPELAPRAGEPVVTKTLPTRSPARTWRTGWTRQDARHSFWPGS